VAENTIFGTQYGMKDSEVSQLKKMFGLSLSPQAEVCDCFALELLYTLPNDKRVEQFCDYLLENFIDADSSFPPPVWSECTALSLRTKNSCELFHVHFSALFYIAHYEIFVLISALQRIQIETYIKMRSVTTRRFKKSATFIKEDFISSKIGQYRVDLISRNEFVSSISYKFLPNTHLYFLIPCTYDATCHFCNCTCYCTKYNRYYTCQTTVSQEI